MNFSIKATYSTEGAWEEWDAIVEVPDELEGDDAAIEEYIKAHPNKIEWQSLSESGNSGMTLTEVEVDG